MHIDHIALWTDDLEQLKDFYVKYFGCTCNDRYANANRGFSSYFLSFDEGARIEIMKKESIKDNRTDQTEKIGLSHFAISVGSKELVIQKTEELRKDGFTVLSEPRTTGDGYFESVICDPEGNLIEITV